MSMRAIGIAVLLCGIASAQEPKPKVIWDCKLPALGRGTAAVADGMIYAPLYDGSAFVAIDAEKGKVRWRTPLQDTSPFSPILDKDSVYVITSSCTLYRLARSNGEILWSRWLASSIHSMPALSEGKIFAAASDTRDRKPREGGWHLLCLEARTGVELWAEPIGADVLGAPMVNQGYACVSLQDGNVAALGVDDGKTVWKHPVSARSMPVPWRERLVFHSSEGLAAVERKDGDASLIYTPEGKSGTGGPSPEFAYPMVSGDHAYVSFNGIDLLCVDLANKHATWAYSEPGQNLGSPVTVGGRVYFGTSAGRLFCLDAGSGRKVWSVSPHGVLLDAPTIVGGRIYLYKQGRALTCVDTGNPEATGWGMWGGNPEHTGGKKLEEQAVTPTPDGQPGKPRK